MAERLTNQMRQSREKKKRIYDVAMKMFLEYGYEQTTIRDICKEAGITNSTFYNFFGDKLGILLQFDYEALSSGNSFLEITEENMQHPYQAICDFCVHTTLKLAEYNNDLARQIIFNTHRLLGDNYNHMPENNTTLRITNFLRMAQEYGTIPQKADYRKDAEYLIMGINGINFHWLTLAGNQDIFEMMQWMLPRVFSAITDEKVEVRRI